MNNKEFISELARRTGGTQDTTQRMVRSVVEEMSRCFDEGGSVVVPAFGTFEVKKRKERILINPGTGQRMLVPPKLVLAFRAATAVKEKLQKTEAAHE